MPRKQSRLSHSGQKWIDFSGQQGGGGEAVECSEDRNVASMIMSSRGSQNTRVHGTRFGQSRWGLRGEGVCAEVREAGQGRAGDQQLLSPRSSLRTEPLHRDHP